MQSDRESSDKPTRQRWGAGTWQLVARCAGMQTECQCGERPGIAPLSGEPQEGGGQTSSGLQNYHGILHSGHRAGAEC